MPNDLRAGVRQYWVAARAVLALTAVLGIAYPLVMTGVAQVAAPANADGSLVTLRGATVASTLIGEAYTDRKGDPLTQWFQSRPSAAGDGYDGNASSGSNLGPDSATLATAIEKRRAIIEKTYGVTAAQIPADALTASGSGLDPDISPAYAALQIATVARTRGIDVATVERLVRENTRGRMLGFLGDPVVNVVQLNLDLAKIDPAGDGR